LGCTALRLGITFSSSYSFLKNICRKLISEYELELEPRERTFAGPRCHSTFTMTATWVKSMAYLSHCCSIIDGETGRDLKDDIRIPSRWRKDMRNCKSCHTQFNFYEPTSPERTCIHEFEAEQLLEIMTDSPLDLDQGFWKHAGYQ